eukprot:GFUD01055523.1.p1 GENE.GFUD01055523.1~~GFUD01055523.1.p1  ORF type:complete len:125 (-),score=11.73 GFUD01055523.1:158-532(-)
MRVFLFILFAVYSPHSHGITLYSCDQENIVNGSCTEGEKTSWCPQDRWCVKTWENYEGISWNCSHEGPVDDYEGCTSETKDPSTEDTECYCSSDLCNSSGVEFISFSLFVFVLVLDLYAVLYTQ